MSSRWENVVTLAREVDAYCAKGQVPDNDTVARLAQAVIDFERELSRARSSGPPEGRS
ncbi:MAG TPA: hypothetical protein VMI75_35655 [Polyangiaceae bacterium]|nr:hypothetical protein [Polyangiaceae bacterium]